jgi:hypothetical protein
MRTIEIKDREMVDGSMERLPNNWGTAQGYKDGWYACDQPEGGDAWAWDGPFETEDEAIAKASEIPENIKAEIAALEAAEAAEAAEEAEEAKAAEAAKAAKDSE